MLYYLTTGIVLGAAAGLSPGPLLTLVISETLKHGVVAGIKVAFAPILTDAPIIAVTLLLFSQLSDLDNILGVITILGAGYVFYLGYQSVGQDKQHENGDIVSPASLSKGMVTNALSPHPYLFWLSIGTPLLVQAGGVNAFSPALFIGGFYLLLVGSKLAVAIWVGKSRSLLSSRGYLRTLNFLGLVLIGFSFLLFIDALRLFGVIDA